MPPPPAARFLDPLELYDLCHGWIDHDAHAARLLAALTSAGLPASARVLEAACGSGLWLRALSRADSSLELSGFDLDEAALDRARRHLPDATLFQADLRAWTPPEPVDAVLAIFGALAFVPPSELPHAARCICDALRPGGLALVEGWVSPRDFHPGTPQQVVVDTPWLKICRQVLPERHGDQAVLRFHHLVCAPGLPPQQVVTKARLYLHEDTAIDDALEEADLLRIETLPGTVEGRRLGLWRRAP